MNEETLFHRARAKPPAERPAFLEEACGGDAALRERVEALLRAHDSPSPFLARLPAGDPPPEPPQDEGVSPASAEGPGRRVGPFKLLQRIGEGGLATVYMAEQTEPVRRKVALKVLKPGPDGKQVLARFEAERQALALLDHPNLVTILDAGTTAAGRPYFAMELVKGVPITAYCDSRCLTPRERLALFLPVCQAVQHAHQKGVIHRDLKPSNVLVAQYDGRPVPKVIDFGLAKVTGQRLIDKTLATEFGAVAGTLEYLSPEQAEVNNQDIDTRSDVYALGVLLYELLTGSTPLERERLQGAGPLEALRLIREEKPPRPSTRLGMTAEQSAVAARRGLEPKRLGRLVRGGLDAIVMKCLEKDRNRRYDTAAGLARDVERYLAADPPPAAYRPRTFLRRHKRTVLAAVVLVAVLLVLVALALAGLPWIPGT
jgi:serine/threonine protein kinase